MYIFSLSDIQSELSPENSQQPSMQMIMHRHLFIAPYYNTWNLSTWFHENILCDIGIETPCNTFGIFEFPVEE